MTLTVDLRAETLDSPKRKMDFCLLQFKGELLLKRTKCKILRTWLIYLERKCHH